MGFFSRFERRVEDGFEGINDKLFDAPISPVQIEKKAEKQMRREKMVGAGKEFAPTLYTVLVNPDDDERLFGYYPTLAGETETYLRAKAMEQGLAMDGAPLVRFIVDDDLKHGKFDVIAELVSAPIIEQLRQEEMTRYGLAGAYPQQSAQAGAVPSNGYAQNNASYSPQNQGATPYNQQSYNQAGEAGYQNYQASPQSFDNMAPGAGAGMGAGVGAPGASATPQANPYDPYAPSSAGIDVMADEAYDQLSSGAHSPSHAAVAEPIAVGQTLHLNNMPQPNGQSSFTEPHLVNLTTGRSFALSMPQVLIGRATNCDIVLNDLNVSRNHAEVRRESTTAWSVADLGSTNGTLVNGRHIAEVMLNEGDRITTGTTTFLFTFH
jgi:hypothetical protein